MNFDSLTVLSIGNDVPISSKAYIKFQQQKFRLRCNNRFIHTLEVFLGIMAQLIRAWCSLGFEDR